LPWRIFHSISMFIFVFNCFFNKSISKKEKRLNFSTKPSLLFNYLCFKIPSPMARKFKKYFIKKRISRSMLPSLKSPKNTNPPSRYKKRICI
jgi:hypothetical protein